MANRLPALMSCFSVLRRRALTGHGGRTENLFAVETTTSDAGQLRLPKQEFPAQPFFLNTIYHNPRLACSSPATHC